MKSLAVVSTLIVAASAGMNRPAEFSIGINTDNRGSALGGLEPMVKWSTSQRIGPTDVDVRRVHVECFLKNLYCNTRRSLMFVCRLASISRL
jgi:hypothetical protein